LIVMTIVCACFALPILIPFVLIAIAKRNRDQKCTSRSPEILDRDAGP
jgi:uncharacterized MAPEG superfamily protein